MIKYARKNTDVSIFKMDLHIHTPASKCYKRDFQLMKRKNISKYLRYQAYESGVSIIAITDHNTVKGYYEMIGLYK